MNTPELSDPTHHIYPLVLLGGGHSHVLWLKHWQALHHQHPAKKIRPLLISDNINSPYSGMLPGLLTKEHRYEDCHIDLITLCRKSASDFKRLTCTNIQKIEHPEFSTLYQLDFLSDEHQVEAPYSIFCETLSINIGSQPSSIEQTTFNHSATHWKVKPISQFYDHWKELKELLNTPVIDTPTIHIIGAGAAGVEIACAVKLAQSTCRVTLISRSSKPLPSFNKKTQQLCVQRLKKLGIDFIHTDHIKEPANALLKDADISIYCTPSTAPHWLQETHLSLSDDGFIRVDGHLQSSLPGVFAAGDCIHFEPQTLAKSGVYAVREAATLFHNICAYISSQPLQSFKPQSTFLSIINMDNRYALAQRGRWSSSGTLLWYYKRFIDRRFMSQFIDADSEYSL